MFRDFMHRHCIPAPSGRSFHFLPQRLADAAIVASTSAPALPGLGHDDPGDRTRFSEVEESVLPGSQASGRRRQSLQQLQRGAADSARCGLSAPHAVGFGYFRVPAERSWFGLDPAFNYGGMHGMRSNGKAIEFLRIGPDGQARELRSA
jgi:hypothetical protein